MRNLPRGAAVKRPTNIGLTMIFFDHRNCTGPLILLLAATPLCAQDSSTDLAKKLSNPIASLISIPFQFNYDHGYGPLDW